MLQAIRARFLFPLLILTASASAAPAQSVFQYSTIDALLAGLFDGEMTVGELLDRGDFGLGTFNGVDGEMVVYEGTVYRAKVDGALAEAGADEKTPFATVTRFPKEPVPVEGEWKQLDYPGFKKALDAKIAAPNLFQAIRIEGAFTSIRYRSVPKQEKPYPPLAKVVEEQVIFVEKGISGTLVGFRSPDYSSGISVPGYHLHFLSDDRSTGGHVLDFTLGDVRVDAVPLREWTVVLPDTAEFADTSFATEPGSLDKVER